MANRVSRTEFGIDVAKDELVLYCSDTERYETLVNSKSAIKSWLKSLVGKVAIAIEATNVYHINMIDLAHAHGVEVFIIDGFQLNNYRKGIGQRAKTDSSDAWLLARYLRNEGAELRAWTPPPPAYRQLQSLLRRRALLVQIMQSAQLSLSSDPSVASELKAVKSSLSRAVLSIEKKIKDALKQAGLTNQVARIQAIEGIGFLTATALVMTFIRGEFTSSDAYIAFLGMDLRVSDSGNKRGQRALSKRGCGEVRRLLHNAGMSASRTETWKEFYKHHLSRGLKTTQVLVMLARKLARVAFSLMKNQTEYRPATLRAEARLS